MKKILLFTAAIAFAFTTAQAQEIRLGAKVGVNFANLNSSDSNFDMDGLTSFHIGGLVEIPITEEFAIQPELVYSAQGGQLKGSEEYLGMTMKYEAKNKIDYVNIPIMAKYYLIEGLALEAGPQIGFLTSAKSEYEISFDGETESETVDFKKELKSIDFGIGLGASYRLEAGAFLSLRYNLGLSDIGDSKDDDFAGFEKVKHGVFQISVGYSF